MQHDSFEWGRVMLAVGLLTAMFLVPVFTFWQDGRAARRLEEDQRKAS